MRHRLGVGSDGRLGHSRPPARNRWGTSRVSTGIAAAQPQLWNSSRLTPTLAVTSVGMLAFRCLVIACQAATIWVTWPLWDHHNSPPMLPTAPLPSFDVGLPLLATLVITLFAPFLGLLLH